MKNLGAKLLIAGLLLVSGSVVSSSEQAKFDGGAPYPTCGPAPLPACQPGIR
jgi:hypothetical protein